MLTMSSVGSVGRLLLDEVGIVMDDGREAAGRPLPRAYNLN